jgi:arginyl-tRNA synthetase
MWKLGVLGADFRYRRYLEYETGKTLWTTDTKGGAAEGHPSFGAADRVYNVIDVRQSYPQAVVKNALLLTGHAAQAEASVHYSYEMVALSPRTAEALGFTLSEEERQASHVEMSGRRGLGVKASDLLDLLVEEARKRVAATNEERGLGLSPAEVAATAEDVGVGALRYYMAKVTRNRIIAFDVDEALQFQGEAGPYLQYSAVRAANIFRKLEDERGLAAAGLAGKAAGDDFALLADDATWEVVLAAARVPAVVARAADSLEIATLAKHGFVLCQAFNAFYRDNSVLHAETATLRRERASVASVFLLALRQVLGLLGVPEPERM